MEKRFIPALVVRYLEAFRAAFNSPGYSHFKTFIWAFMLVQGQKRVIDVANTCVFMKRHASRFERFLSEHKWSMHQVIASLVSLLFSQLADRLMVHAAFLLAEDSTFASKPSKKMPGVQRWKDYSSNPDRSPDNKVLRRSLLAGDCIRDLKQHFGFGDYQSTIPIAINRFFQLYCTAFCIWKLMLLPDNASTWLVDIKPTAITESAFSFARARRGLRRFVIKRIFFIPH